ncbi:cytochrome b562 [Vibrio rumoiensis]|uniref:Cytochrome b562 family protein n=1 Tax=Vibrio rumoiensis 1S-45 TaxID=1188252 RepID=A0A1E5E2A0_9VIBR|nr:cytochrome b562 [Vibrio rumoiensis]OEF25551.1 cytochrome b562 family protein [Vibrio rumoiensis 1S-45]
MKKLIPFIALLVTANVYAAGFDLKATMKEMKVEFNQAAKAQNIDEMKKPVTNMTELINKAKLGVYPPEKQSLYLEGFNKLTVTLASVETHLEAGEFDQAKEELRKVDDLRIEYHDKRNPSIWSKLFG